MNVAVSGTLSFDYIMDYPGRFADRIMPDKIHNISLSFLVDTLSKQFGGTAGNIAYTLKLLGADPMIIAPAGNDFVLYKKHLAAHGISTKYISIHRDIPTSSYFVITDKGDNQIGSFYSGATKYAKRLTLPKNDFVMLAPTEPVAMIKMVQNCTKSHFRYMYDPAFQIAEFSPNDLREGISGAEILIGNDYEIALIEQKLNVSHEELIVMVPVVVTTLGAKGSIIETRHEQIHCKPAHPAAITDPTGAGDAYRAGFLYGYLRHFDLQVCGQMGSVSAVYTVEKYGTQTHTFTKKQFVERYMENFGTILQLQ